MLRVNGMAALDARLFRFLHDLLSQPRGSVPFMLALSFVGSGWAMLAFLPLLAPRRTRHYAFALLGTLLAVGVVVWTIKLTVRRVRPYRCLENITCFVVDAPHDYSFPSGHTAGSFTAAAFIATILFSDRGARRWPRWTIALCLLFLAYAVGLSRIGLGVHFPGDVIAGALLGGSVGTLGGRLYVRHRERERRATAAVTPDDQLEK